MKNDELFNYFFDNYKEEKIIKDSWMQKYRVCKNDVDSFKSREAIEYNYIVCLALCKLYFNGAKYIDNEAKMPLKDIIHDYYNEYHDYSIAEPWHGEYISKKYNVTYDGALNDSYDMELNLCHCYDMCSYSTKVGIKKFLSYAYFNILVEDKKYDDAIIISKEIGTISKFDSIYSNYAYSSPILNEQLLCSLKDDLLLMINDSTIYERDRSLYELFDELECNKKGKIISNILPSIKVLSNYYLTLNDENKKEALLYLLKLFPSNKYVDNLNNIIEKKEIKSNIDILTNELKLKDNELAEKVLELSKTPHWDNIYENICSKYPEINFDNLSEKTRKFIATGDYVYECMASFKNSDFSAAVIEWCKAVENETRKKIYLPIKNDEKILNHINKNNIFIDPQGTLGSIKYLRKELNYIYENLFINIYAGKNKGYYTNLFIYITELNENFRTNSAHPETIPDYKAKKCKSMVLASKRILEMLSKL